MSGHDAQIRQAHTDDIPALVELSEQKRLQYQHYQPLFWRKAAKSRELQHAFFTHLLTRENVIALVYEEDGHIGGFLFADLIAAPPVYDPQGLTCRIDDFCLAEGQSWEQAGQTLLTAAWQAGKQRGASQSVVVCGHLDQPKRTLLANAGLTIASEWYVKEL